MDKIAQRKLQIRKELKYNRSSLTKENREKGNVIITDKVLGHNFFHKATKVLIYVTYKEEVDTTEIIKECFGQKKEVYVPKVIGNHMVFKQINSFLDLVEGYQKILEPKEELKDYNYKETDFYDTLVVIPGLGFDLNLHRIGYGKGYYDKFLANHPFSMKMGVAFGEQMIEEIPVENTDITMDVVVTSKLNLGGYYS